MSFPALEPVIVNVHSSGYVVRLVAARAVGIERVLT
jgi:hypothetical protein